ncbi:MAG: hypothetical protein C0501_06480 [Isosphaera sp.]|nr:hypothetical protein [Isosphaera sp.]
MRAAWALAGLAFALAAAGARPQPGGLNDGSRLATAESLIDRGTLAIDDSVFVRPPPDLAARVPIPDDPDLPYTVLHGTQDKVLIGGRFYSDKPMVPAVLVAAAYRLLMPLGLPQPGDRPDVFCRVATILTCAPAYAAAVGFMWVLGRRAGLSAGWRLAWLGGFALATVLPAYTRNVNAGLPLTAAAAAAAVCLARVAPVGAGTAAGVAYAVDPVTGGLLVVAAAVAVGVRTRRAFPVVVLLVAAFPWAAAHHAVNYAVGGVWVPLGLVPEYLAWPGSPFDRSNMTGLFRHDPAGLAEYLRMLFFGRNGFLVTNLPLLLAAGFGWRVLAKPGPGRVEVAALACWAAGVVAVYALLSDNWGGGCLSVRWFVPLVVPGFWVLARLLAEYPTYRADFAVLAGCGLVTAVGVWPCGPWVSAAVPRTDYVAWPAVGLWAAVRARAVLRRPPSEPDA